VAEWRNARDDARVVDQGDAAEVAGVLALQPVVQPFAGPLAIGQIMSPLGQGHIGQLGRLRQFGVGVARDAQQAVAWLQQPLGHGQPHAA